MRQNICMFRNIIFEYRWNVLVRHSRVNEHKLLHAMHSAVNRRQHGSLVVFSSFLIFSAFVQCGRLGWLAVSLSADVNTSYHYRVASYKVSVVCGNCPTINQFGPFRRLATIHQRSRQTHRRTTHSVIPNSHRRCRRDETVEFCSIVGANMRKPYRYDGRLK